MARIYLDAVLEPPRSMSERGIDRMMLILGSVSLFLSCAFLLVKAWPVAGFLGLEMLLLWALLRNAMRRQRAKTFLRVTADAVDVRRVDGRGQERRTSFPAGFARVEFDEADRSPRALSLAHSSRRYAIGEHLTQAERASLAVRLRQALAEARRERFSIGES